ncbi:hypothetical protein KL918_003373 [Ogataea parapolymorpha]|uniref:Aminodeoxychorismate lyase n=1 Tax=Ogataea parapolymorpha (strain ATCC 26012 / BCRC 20466 / JCM 22074 / NRRL Y-7560 / DL-1) TaxID=871575 RepID=W1Q7A8_OGAPD|nr:Aminodeoxychorismate lyase [Ogataea parapolymorpha DL-1]ESW95817.1 Aminodeoxychorismate lyase [Ogataea parapolymorpha DL-1]KAG7866476.1 hypothetical protein KL918_003373 [Ogataea parapolymorpha]KAG7872588.1 hypothetical protein KL916_002983 [Ogataea parapolymorpha]
MGDLETVANEVIQKHLKDPFDYEKVQFEVLSTIRYDPVLYSGSLSLPEALVCSPLDQSFFLFLDYHVDRLNETAEFFELPAQKLNSSLLAAQLSQALYDKDVYQAHKMRYLLNKDGQVEIQAVPIASSLNLDINCPPTWTLYLDSEPTIISPFTSFKSTYRSHYTEARKRKIPPGAENADVVLFNHADQITETSICNIAVLRNDKNPLTGEINTRWTTPPLSSGCLCGVTRRYLLEKGLISEGVIMKNSIKDGEQVLIFNGIMGVAKAVIKL